MLLIFLLFVRDFNSKAHSLDLYFFLLYLFFFPFVFFRLMSPSFGYTKYIFNYRETSSLLGVQFILLIQAFFILPFFFTFILFYFYFQCSSFQGSNIYLCNYYRLRNIRFGPNGNALKSRGHQELINSVGEQRKMFGTAVSKQLRREIKVVYYTVISADL